MNDTRSGSERAPTQDSCPAVTGTAPTADNACCKVERVAEAYGLEGLDAELRRRREQNDATLHELAAYLNERVTAVALSAAGVELDAEPGTVYAALENSDDLDIGRRDEIREAMAGHLDIDRLRTDYTSHETIRKHLKDHLDVSTSRGSIETVQELEDALQTYEQQYETAVASALERAAERGLLSGGDFGVFSTRVECRECSTTYRLDELLASGGCDCQA
ncbi:rod-determining factor RdfA [Salinirussus salinus]|uniref:rod-determining factor RdfA n=1 Tax=Salinirussus salinus TaxID=1198300 RepID=UPI00135B1518|nr:rod-determining factor RdfA [Salinirussus salinus]